MLILYSLWLHFSIQPPHPVNQNDIAFHFYRISNARIKCFKKYSFIFVKMECVNYPNEEK